jgi:putative transposase
MLTQHGWPITPSTDYDAVSRAPSARARRDELLKAAIARVHAGNYGVCGARKVWLQLNREGIEVARCTVARLMRDLGLRGARRGKRMRTTIADPAAARPADLARRQFSPPAPDRIWVAGALDLRADRADRLEEAGADFSPADEQQRATGLRRRRQLCRTRR